MSRMTTPEKRFPIGTRVRLRDGVDEGFYEGLGRPGNEGWIRKRRKDEFDYNHVMVEWDKDHWSYNGAPDCWTWENHFDIVEEPMAEKKFTQGEVEKIIKNAFKGAGLTDEQVEEVEESDDEEAPSKAAAKDALWKETVEAAHEATKDSKAFILLALHMKPEDGDTPAIVVPVVIQNSRNKEFNLVLQSQLAHLSMALYDGLIGQQIKNEE